MSEPVIQSWDLLGRAVPEVASAPPPDEEWPFSSGPARGTAWVYRGTRNAVLVRPVILADGFRLGPSSLDELWFGVNALFPFARELRDRGQDLILLGYEERSASILHNADVVIDCIRQAIQQRQGTAPLVVGGFSMGGLVTRYALAKLESMRTEHETAVYISYDSPHRGAWIPIGVQALAHFIARNGGSPAMSMLVNSPAARQLLWRHLETVDGEYREDPLRTEFLERLNEVGGWPQVPAKFGVAAGRGDGTGNGVPPGNEVVRSGSGNYAGTVLHTQASGTDVSVAKLAFKGADPMSIRTSGIPELDSAPGGTLDSFGLAAASLGIPTKQAYPLTCFVPTVSAVAVAGPDSLDSAIGLPVSELDDFRCSSLNLPHSAPITPELGTWILGQIKP